MPRDAQAAPSTQSGALPSQRVNRVRTLLGLPPLRQSAQPDAARHLEPVAIPAQIEPAVPTVPTGWPIAGQSAEEAWIAEEVAATVAEREAVMPSKSPANDQPARPQRAQVPTLLPSRPASDRPRAGEEEARTAEHPFLSHVVAEQTSIPSEQQRVAQADGLPNEPPDEPDLHRAASAPEAAQPSAVALTTIDIPGHVSQSTAAKQPDGQSSAPRPVSKPMPVATQHEHPVSMPDDTTGDTMPAQVPVSGQPHRLQPVDAPVDMPMEGPRQESVRPLPPPVAALRLEMPLPSIGGQAIAEPIAPPASALPHLGSVAPTDADEHDKRLPTAEHAPQPTIQPVPEPSPKPPSSTEAVVPTVQPAARAQAPFGQSIGEQRVSVQSVVAHEQAFPALEPSRPEQPAWANRPAEGPNNRQASHMVQALRKQIDALTAKVAGLEKAHQAPPPPAQPTVIVRNRRVPHTTETRAFWARSYRGRAHLRT